VKADDSGDAVGRRCLDDHDGEDEDDDDEAPNSSMSRSCTNTILAARCILLFLSLLPSPTQLSPTQMNVMPIVHLHVYFEFCSVTIAISEALAACGHVINVSACSSHRGF